ncbi:MAG TPA: hypothetical protein DDZ91_03470 [Firmicutes bacterium]|jgi:hypothetical protein|nr:hypothetical protein [Bacillota bacterium]
MSEDLIPVTDREFALYFQGMAHGVDLRKQRKKEIRKWGKALKRSKKHDKRDPFKTTKGQKIKR